MSRDGYALRCTRCDWGISTPTPSRAKHEHSELEITLQWASGRLGNDWRPYQLLARRRKASA